MVAVCSVTYLVAVQGCDGSVLITSTPGNTAERDADDNKSLAPEGFDTVNAAKAAVEDACPDVVSCADILTIAARDAIALVSTHLILQSTLVHVF
jgi:peroxidase